MRMMPCMAGWAGPTPTCRFWPLPVPLPSPSMNARVVVSAMRDLRLLPGADQRLAAVDGVVLAQRVAGELLVHQQPAQIGVAGKADPEHVPHLALEPVGDGPQVDRGGHLRVVLVHPHLDAQAVVVA